MAILFPQADLYLKTITMRHLWVTAQKLRREADRQEIKVRRFIRKKGFGHRETQVALGCSRDSKDIKDQKSPGLPQS